MLSLCQAVHVMLCCATASALQLVIVLPIDRGQLVVHRIVKLFERSHMTQHWKSSVASTSNQRCTCCPESMTDFAIGGLGRCSARKHTQLPTRLQLRCTANYARHSSCGDAIYVAALTSAPLDRGTADADGGEPWTAADGTEVGPSAPCNQSVSPSCCFISNYLVVCARAPHSHRGSLYLRERYGILLRAPRGNIAEGPEGRNKLLFFPFLLLFSVISFFTVSLNNRGAWQGNGIADTSEALLLAVATLSGRPRGLV